MASAPEPADVLIVGTGTAGAQAATSLRQLGFSGSVVLIGEEQDPPYERPPLSKDYLTGGKAFERILIRPPDFWRERGIDLRLGTRVAAVRPDEHQVVLADGMVLSYRHLVWAAGGRARRLACPGGDLAQVHVVRTRADVDRIQAQLPDAARIAIVGGGYVGLEAAASLVGRGKPVVLVEALPRLLSRVAGETLSRFFEAQHRARGVDMIFGRTVTAIDHDHGRLRGLRLDDGAFVPADLVIVGIGIAPEVGPLTEAGADGSDGVAVDGFCRTTLPDIWAVGDCALHANAFADGRSIRLESVQNASDMAVVAAKAIARRPEPYHSLPWFWSTQYDLKLQTVGLSSPGDQAIVRGDLAEGRFSIIHLRNGRVVALDCVNRPSDFVQGRGLIGCRPPDPDALARADVPLKTLAQAA